MHMTVSTPAVRRGGAWLVETTEPDAVFTPERLTDEHRLIGRTAREFVEGDVLPQLDRLEQKDWTLARQLVVGGGALGLLGVAVPEPSGGVAMDKASPLVVSAQMSRSASFGATFGASRISSSRRCACLAPRRRSKSTCP